MSTKIKGILTGIILGIYYFIDLRINQRLEEVFTVANVDAGGYAFVSLQLIQWICIWSLPILFITLFIIWFKELKWVHRRIKK